MPSSEWLAPALRRLLTTLDDLARERQLSLYLVGGVLREAWSPAPSAARAINVDLAVSRDAMRLARAVADATRGTLVVLDEPLGAVRVIVGRDDERYELDLNDFRAPTIEGDLAKRDFTVNAMALDVHECLQRTPETWAQTLLDPLGGRGDLARGLLRAVYAETFRDDPVRILRGISLAARRGWTIDEPTQRLMRAAAPELPRVAGERLRDELFKLFTATRAATYVRLADELGALAALFPEILPCRGTDQGPHHHLDVWAHSLETLVQLEATLTEAWYPSSLWAFIQPYLDERLAGEHSRLALLKLVALLHDIGKPATRTVDETGRLWFTGHEHLGAQMAAKIAERLKLSAKEREALVRHIAAHLRPGFLSREPVITQRAIYRFFRDTAREGPGVLLVWMADRLASRGRDVPPEEIPHQRAVIERLLAAYFVRPEESVSPPRLVTGHDLMQALHLPPGPTIGELLTAIAEAQVERKVTTREAALQFAQHFLQGAR